LIFAVIWTKIHQKLTKSKKKFAGFETLRGVTVKLSLPLVSAAFLFCLLFNPEDGSNIYPLHLVLSPNYTELQLRIPPSLKQKVL
jgi:hypothetical protein